MMSDIKAQWRTLTVLRKSSSLPDSGLIGIATNPTSSLCYNASINTVKLSL
jgi:hypothetical protein